MVDLKNVRAETPAAKAAIDKAAIDKAARDRDTAAEETSPPPPGPEPRAAEAPGPVLSEEPEAGKKPALAAEDEEKAAETSPATEEMMQAHEDRTVQKGPPPIVIPPPLRDAGEFLATKKEKLSYRISLLGVPVGSAELEAKKVKGEVRITLRTRSNAALAGVYPVDDLLETRHIGGNFILTKFRQQEGNLKRNIGFTLFLRDKRVFWIDLMRMRITNETVPTTDVLDTLSAFYYLRNRQLEIGTTEMLHIYDGDIYGELPVKVLRREEILLPNLKNVDTLVLRPVPRPGGVFKRNRDMLIWFTNDENRVPVKVETSTPIGRITALLVADEAS